MVICALSIVRRNRFQAHKRRVIVATASRKKSRASAGKTVRAMFIEVPVYAALVVGYFFLVLHFLGDWLGHIYQDHRLVYAVAAIGLIIGQAVVLESVTTLLLRLLQGGRSE